METLTGEEIREIVDGICNTIIIVTIIWALVKD